MADQQDKIKVSDHAVLQHLKRTGAIVSRHNKILRIVAFGEEIKPKNRLMKLLNNNCKKAKYYKYGALIAVVEENTVVTVYKYEPDKWLDSWACCFQCKKPIIKEDDDAMVCIQCGGRNRRMGTTIVRRKL